MNMPWMDSGLYKPQILNSPECSLCRQVWSIGIIYELQFFAHLKYVRVHLAIKPATMKPYKIKVFWTHVLYVTITIKRNMRAQLLMFTKWCLQQNMCSTV